MEANVFIMLCALTIGNVVCLTLISKWSREPGSTTLDKSFYLVGTTASTTHCLIRCMKENTYRAICIFRGQDKMMCAVSRTDKMNTKGRVPENRKCVIFALRNTDCTGRHPDSSTVSRRCDRNQNKKGLGHQGSSNGKKKELPAFQKSLATGTPRMVTKDQEQTGIRMMTSPIEVKNVAPGVVKKGKGPRGHRESVGEAEFNGGPLIRPKYCNCSSRDFPNYVSSGLAYSVYVFNKKKGIMQAYDFIKKQFVDFPIKVPRIAMQVALDSSTCEMYILSKRSIRLTCFDLGKFKILKRSKTIDHFGVDLKRRRLLFTIVNFSQHTLFSIDIHNPSQQYMAQLGNREISFSSMNLKKGLFYYKRDNSLYSVSYLTHFARPKEILKSPLLFTFDENENYMIRCLVDKRKLDMITWPKMDNRVSADIKFGCNKLHVFKNHLFIVGEGGIEVRRIDIKLKTVRTIPFLTSLNAKHVYITA